MFLSGTAFIADMFNANVLKFGDFTLKSGIKCPYFFDLGAIDSGAGLQQVGFAFAQKIDELNFSPDVLFGPAYKGIPLVVTTAISLLDFGKNTEVCFDRKEVKQHGEGGKLVGAGLAGKTVLLIDDVITDGASKVEAYELIRSHGGNVLAILVALDRNERDGNTNISYLKSLEETLEVGIYSIASIKDVLAYLERHQELKEAHETVQRYADAHCEL
ncbi:MAG: orotate phosphoribosyltransferase [Gammaproteobacteria bacterium]|nr:orotate phosphoribosyltransferase [Gammaproteobacteria bacterium]MXX95563.1 orotate phosphoribosyltransferase [Gammaproteobacteria bacterium]MYF53998.1 orotate phosphoribosyltransferase [Gammaproteobacteria bacterium]MYK43963.1 orotate phosphoribosyltransferase [Gammaproteobacteria bacterium]